MKGVATTGFAANISNIAAVQAPARNEGDANKSLTGSGGFSFFMTSQQIQKPT